MPEPSLAELRFNLRLLWRSGALNAATRQCRASEATIRFAEVTFDVRGGVLCPLLCRKIFGDSITVVLSVLSLAHFHGEGEPVHLSDSPERGIC